MFRLYAQFPEAVNWPRMSVLILLFAVSDVALFCLIGQTARKAELETANRLLNDQLDNQLKALLRPAGPVRGQPPPPP